MHVRANKNAKSANHTMQLKTVDFLPPSELPWQHSSFILQLQESMQARARDVLRLQ
jgi:hypothetical protein